MLILRLGFDIINYFVRISWAAIRFATIQFLSNIVRRTFYRAAKVESTTYAFNFLLPTKPVPKRPMLNRTRVAGSGVGESCLPPFKR